MNKKNNFIKYLINHDYKTRTDLAKLTYDLNNLRFESIQVEENKSDSS
jgi:hypothetical protein